MTIKEEMKVGLQQLTEELARFEDLMSQKKLK